MWFGEALQSNLPESLTRYYLLSSKQVIESTLMRVFTAERLVDMSLRLVAGQCCQHKRVDWHRGTP